VAICLETGYEFDQAKKIKEMIENPDAFKSNTPVVNNVPSKVEEVVKEVDKPVEEVKEEKDESSGGDMGFSFFDDQ